MLHNHHRYYHFHFLFDVWKIFLNKTKKWIPQKKWRVRCWREMAEASLPPLRGRYDLYTAHSIDCDDNTELTENDIALRRKNEELHRKVSELRRSIKEKSEKCTQITTDCNMTKVDMVELHRSAQEFRKLKEQLDSAINDNRTVEMDIAKRREVLESRGPVPRDENKEKIRELEGVLRFEGVEVRERKLYIQTLKGKLHELDGKILRKQKKIQIVKERIAENTARYESGRAHNVKLVKAIDIQERILRDVKSEGESQISQLQAELDAMDKEIAEKGSESESMEANLSILKRDHAMHIRKLDTAVAAAEEFKKLRMPRDPRLLRVNVEKRDKKRNQIRKHVTDMRQALSAAKSGIAAFLENREASEIELSELEEKKNNGDVEEASEFDEPIDSAIERLKDQIVMIDKEVAHKKQRMEWLRGQLTKLECPQEAIDDPDGDFQEEESESELTAYEMIDRIKRLRRMRNDLKLESMAIKGELTGLEGKGKGHIYAMEQIDGIVSRLISGRVISGDKKLSDFPGLDDFSPTDD
jgi:chromosome segregation ATPase